MRLSFLAPVRAKMTVRHSTVRHRPPPSASIPVTVRGGRWRTVADDQLRPFDCYAPGAVLPCPLAHDLDPAPAQQRRDPAQLAGEPVRLARDGLAVVGEGEGASADLLEQLRSGAAPAAPVTRQAAGCTGPDRGLR
jgi:hypothetical protein